MKKFACGDVVPGCAATFESATEDGIIEAVGRHAAADHDMTAVPDEVVTAVRRAIVSV
ncbi:MAG: DUF1059 domain-containing protein [Ilumatobacter sp.]|uniref:DUF1059 domain-containing protein n=1 Tax=Ilumatobacter sp. TaxID=1967498 RepID=UPI003C72A1A0